VVIILPAILMSTSPLEAVYETVGFALNPEPSPEMTTFSKKFAGVHVKNQAGLVEFPVAGGVFGLFGSPPTVTVNPDDALPDIVETIC